MVLRGGQEPLGPADAAPAEGPIRPGCRVLTMSLMPDPESEATKRGFILMKRILFVFCVFIFFVMTPVYAAENKVDIYVPNTLSSIPIMELDNEVINGRAVRVHLFDDHIMSMAEFVNGKFPLLMTGFSVGLARYRAAGDIAMIATPVWGVSSLVTHNPELKKLSDFKGKTLLVPFAKSPLDLQLKAILKKENLIDQVKINYAVVQQQVPMLLARKADGICLPEPLVSKLVLEKKGFKVFSFAKKWGEVNNGEERSPQVSLFTKKSFTDANPILISGLIQKIKNRVEFVKKNSTEAAEKYSGKFSLDKSVMEAGLNSVLFDMTDIKTEASICRDYENAIGDSAGIAGEFFYNYR